MKLVKGENACKSLMGEIHLGFLIEVKGRTSILLPCNLKIFQNRVNHVGWNIFMPIPMALGFRPTMGAISLYVTSEKLMLSPFSMNVVRINLLEMHKEKDMDLEEPSVAHQD
jgi:hypothetical protein